MTNIAYTMDYWALLALSTLFCHLMASPARDLTPLMLLEDTDNMPVERGKRPMNPLHPRCLHLSVWLKSMVRSMMVFGNGWEQGQVLVFCSSNFPVNIPLFVSVKNL
ncbi:uncharacterized protein [Anabrus simplex]|uniref:uncharacterized protein isoform X3 n=1 Tax=Anabrus simplex TaxID=316456 RepID=UPI0035A3BC66